MESYPARTMSSFQEVAGSDFETLKGRLLFSTSSPRKDWPYLLAVVLIIFLVLGALGFLRALFDGRIEWSGLLMLVLVAGGLLNVLDVSVCCDIDVYTTGLAFKDRTMLGWMPGYWIGVPYDELLFVDLRGRTVSAVRVKSEQRIVLAKGMPRDAMRRFRDMLTSFQRRGSIPQTLDIKLA
jgi:hypothetical protein